VNKFLVVLMGCLLSGVIYPAYAENSSLPKLKMKIINNVKNQHLALCLAENCYPIANANQDISLEAFNIDSIVMANIDSMQMYPQVIPPSCKIAIKNNQVLTVTGQVIAKQENVYLNDLACSVADMA
jgi:hypothetical protein